MGPKLGAKQRLTATIIIYVCFFISELAIAIHTRSLALTADAFHYLNDLIGFAVALAALIVKDRKQPPRGPYTFGWQRAPVVGAFFNGIFLLALGVSIFFQSVERFLRASPIDDAALMLIMGCVGFALNIVSAVLLHGHYNHGHGHCCCSSQELVSPKDPEDASSVDLDDLFADSVYRQLHGNHNHFKQTEDTSHVRDLGMLGVMIHVLCDAINNLGVIAAAAIMTFTTWQHRFLADPAASIAISLMILISSWPLIKGSSAILLQSSPRKTDAQLVREDLELIPGVESVHELHIWQLDENKTIATAHLVVSETEISEFTATAQIARECLHAYGIHSATLQPEFLHPQLASPFRVTQISTPCQTKCSKECEDLMCCNKQVVQGSSGVVTDSAASTLYAVSFDKQDKASIIHLTDVTIPICLETW